MKKKLFFILAALSLCLFSSFGAMTADDVLSECVARIKGAKGIDATFSLSMGGRNLTGNLKASGNKFAVSTSAGSTWYNGTAMWNYNPSTDETTVSIPTSSELAEVNPLAYLNYYKSGYNASFSKNKKAGHTIIVLSAKKRSNPVKQVEIAIGNDKLPKSLKITSSGGSSVITISKINLGAKFASGAFEYPKSKYPKAEIIDLR